jgi:hypothetical protein
MSESQKNAFTAWVNTASQALPQVQVHHQVRAQQLRKTAGMLEAYYASGSAPENLNPSFKKEPWTPTGPTYFPYAFRNDHEPSVVVGNIKKHFMSHLVHQDDGVFHMNQVRCQIERHEDLAQHANDGVKKVPALLNRLTVLFGKPEYQAALVHDISDLYKGQPRFRVNQLDDPTPWELDTRSGYSPTTT